MTPAGSPANEPSARLSISSGDTTCELDPGDDLSFGRAGDLVVDENPFMHRIVGRFVYREGVWWLQNQGRRSRLEVVDHQSGTVLEAAPGQQVAVLGAAFSVGFSAGPTSYELTGKQAAPPVGVEPGDDIAATATIGFATVPLSPEQHLLIVALYDSRLTVGTIEGNALLARRLGWSANKFNRKLDAICDKLDRAGVARVKGRPGEHAEGRREAVLVHALEAGLVGPNDLPLLHSHRHADGG